MQKPKLWGREPSESSLLPENTYHRWDIPTYNPGYHAVFRHEKTGTWAHSYNISAELETDQDAANALQDALNTRINALVGYRAECELNTP